MQLKITFEGGYANYHQIPLSELSKFSTSIQRISNYQLRTNSPSLCLTNANKGSMELIIAILTGIATNFATDGIKIIYKKLKTYTSKNSLKNNVNLIKNTYEELFVLYSQLSTLENYNVEYDTLMENINEIKEILESEIGIFNALKEITSLIDNSDNSNKPNNIIFDLMDSNIISTFTINNYLKNEIEALENTVIQLKEIKIEGLINNLKRGPTPFFKINTIDSTEFKIYTTIEDQSNLSDYYRDQEKVYILVQPIVTLGNLTKIKEARLIKILKTKGE